MTSMFKENRNKIRIVRIDMLFMVEKGIRGGIYHALHRYAEPNNKYVKIMIKMKNLHSLNI